MSSSCFWTIAGQHIYFTCKKIMNMRDIALCWDAKGKKIFFSQHRITLLMLQWILDTHKQDFFFFFNSSCFVIGNATNLSHISDKNMFTIVDLVILAFVSIPCQHTYCVYLIVARCWSNCCPRSSGDPQLLPSLSDSSTCPDQSVFFF